MPTGYTADVCNGKVTDFKEFAMRCAKAIIRLGALMTMRDDADAALGYTEKPKYGFCDKSVNPGGIGDKGTLCA